MELLANPLSSTILVMVHLIMVKVKDIVMEVTMIFTNKNNLLQIVQFLTMVIHNAKFVTS